jgi:hypothetical protein
MTLPFFDSLDAVPEPFRAAYELRDGKAVPKADLLGPGGQSAIERMKEAERKAKQAAQEAADRATELQRQLEAQKGGLSSEVLEKWNAEKARELADRDAKLDAMGRQLRGLQLDDKVKAAALEAGMFPKHAATTLRALMDRFDLSGEGKPVVLEDGKPSPKSLPEFFTAHKAEFPELYQAPPASGGGAKPSTGTAPSKVAITDTAGFLANLDGIASGKVAVTTP